MTFKVNWSPNETNFIKNLENELTPAQSTLYWLLISICAAIVWVIYLTYYNSRVLGLVLTAILNRFVKYGHIRFGSFSISVLSGKIMFRDFHLVTEDYSVRLQLGYAIFRWWRPLTDKEITDDLSHSETRLSIYLDSFELHVYNRTANFSRLEKLFGLDQLILPAAKHEDPPTTESQLPSLNTNQKKWLWRDLVPVIKIEVSSGRFAFGNHLIPQTLVVNCRESHIVYTTKPASTPFDLFMHIIKCKSENIRIMVVPSPKYTGKVDEPPRCMGEGFAVLQSSDVEIYYYHDEAGLVPYEPERVELANGDVVSVRTWPCWGMDVKCGKNTDISYGPWADRQREFLWKFFYPVDYQMTTSTVLPDPGQLRLHKSFDFKMSMQNDITIDILFTKNKETQAVHMTCMQGSYLEFTIPMVVDDNGYTTKITGQLMHVDASTSLKFRSLLECETLEFAVEIKYPSVWNDHQDWRCDLTACKAAGYLVFNHKYFFADLVEDWSTKSRPDVFHFVPYTCHINLLLKEFELMTLTNEWNWIDCFGATPENAHLAVCGDTFDLSIIIPFTDFLPDTVPIKLFLRGEGAEARLYLPESNTSRHVIIALQENMKLMERDGTVIEPVHRVEKKWHKICLKRNGWVDVWTTPIAALSIGYTYHPMPLINDESTGLSADKMDAEETLLIPVRLVPMRPLRPKKNRAGTLNSSASLEEDFDPNKMDPDLITVDIEIGPSVCFAYGSLVKHFLQLKENYFGDDQKFTDFEKNITSSTKTSTIETIVTDVREKPFDPRQYRPFSVRVQLTLHDVQAHLVKNCTQNGAPCPSVFLERLVFELDKKYEETRLQVFLSPALLISKDLYQRPQSHGQLQDGHLSLSGLQIRGHAMFSHEGLPLDSETLEYAWLVEIIVGDLTGRLTASQLQNIIEFLQTFVYLVKDPENVLMKPVTYKLCQHMVPQPDCKEPAKNLVSPCPTVGDLKYGFVRVSVDCVDLYLVEAGSALNIQIFPVRLATCNLHSQSTKLGITANIPEVNVKQFVLSIPVNQQYKGDLHVWLEAGGVSLGPIIVDAGVALPCIPVFMSQQAFLRLHDKHSRRLSFLWTDDQSTVKCGCLGGCRFFGNNRNGPTFFNPSENDFAESTNTAVPYISSNGVDFGFGQSILQRNQFVFDLQTLSMPCCNARKIPRSNLPDIDPDKTLVLEPGTPLDNRDPSGKGFQKVDNRREISFADHVGNELSVQRSDFTAKLEKLMEVQERESVDVAGMTRGASVNSVSLDLSASPLDADKTFAAPSLGSPSSDLEKKYESGSLSSLSEIHQKKKSFSRLGHERKRSYEPMRMLDKASPEFAQLNKPAGSKGSLRSSSGASEVRSLSRHSSLTSPVLRRLSSQLSIAPEGSTVSGISNDKFFSAGEEMNCSLYGSARTLDKQDRSLSEKSPVDDPATSSLSSLYENAEQFAGNDSSTEAGSFVSAVSSTHLGEPAAAPATDEEETMFEEEDEESLDTDATQIPAMASYVDLHGQINQPITKSPLLMSCYTSHMTQLSCSNWSMAAPMLHPVPQTPSMRSNDSVGNPLGQTMVYIPQFAYLREGFTTSLMTSKQRVTKSFSSPTNSSFDWSSSSNHGFMKMPEIFQNENDESLSSDCTASKVMAVVNLKGSVDVMVSPLMLEALQRYLEAITPVLSSMHPSTIVDNLHFSCTSSVSEQNRLKKQTNSEDAKKREEGGFAAKDKKKYPSFNKLTKLDSQDETKKASRLQVIFSLSKINVCVLQASLVEEVISIAALEKARELTCVSILAASIDSIKLQLLSNNICQSKSAASSPNAETINKKLVEISTKKHNSLDRDSGVDSDQMVETRLEDVVGSLYISRIHFQLRRMKKNSNYSDNIYLTAIPESRSKVFFTFQKPPNKDFNLMQVPKETYSTRDFFPTTAVEDVAGFVMFECGLEDISLRAARRDGYNSKMADDHLQNVAKMLQDIEKEAKEDLAVPHCSCIPTFSGTGDGKNRRDSYAASAHSEKSSIGGNSADDEASYRSRTSLPTDGTEDEATTEPAAEKLKGDASSCVLEFKTVWFNFAAPPPSPRRRKLEYTRNDWNLLSTATPAINAWMNPCHRAILSANILYSNLNKRICSVMASIMTDALEKDYQGLHLMTKSKFNKTTWLSKCLQDDPSCQLLTVLRRYIHKVGVPAIEESQNDDTMPLLLTIKKGLLVLTRQWKNVLYMPVLADTNFKSKKKMAVVTFAPINASADNVQTNNNMDDGENTLDNYDVVDEKTSLLKAEGGSIQKSRSGLGSVHQLQPPPDMEQRSSSFHTVGQTGESSMISAEATKATSKLRGVPSTQSFDEHLNKDTHHKHKSGTSVSSKLMSQDAANLPTRNESSNANPNSTVPLLSSRVDAPPGVNESNPSMNSVTGSISEQFLSMSVPSTPQHQSLTRQLTELDKRDQEDMNRWMQRQQEFTQNNLGNHQSMHYYPSIGQDSWTNTGISDLSQDDSLSTQRVAAMARPAFQLADAQVLFKPLLKAMGLQLEAIRMSAMMKKFGGDVSIRGVLHALRVEIVDSETAATRRSSLSSKGKGKSMTDQRFELPAFLCETFAVMLSMKDVVDFEKGNTQAKESNSADVPTSEAHPKSWQALKEALEQMEAKPTTTKVNFSINSQSITQHVNMSLLRLVHQFVTMIENVVKTQSELKSDAARTSFQYPAAYAAAAAAQIVTPSDGQSVKLTESNSKTAETVKSDVTTATTTPSTIIYRPPEISPVLPEPHSRHSAGEKSAQTRPNRLQNLGKSPRKPSFGKQASDRHPKIGTEMVQSPLHSINLSDSIAIEMVDTSSPAVAEKTIVDEIKENTPQCWKTLYNILDLYNSMPEMKTINRSQLSVIEEETDRTSISHGDDIKFGTTIESAERQPLQTSAKPRKQKFNQPNFFTQSIIIKEKIPLIVFGVAKVKKINISALLSGLKLEGELQNCQGSFSHREKIKGLTKRKSTESSATASIGHTMIILLEGIQSSMQTVVTMNISKSQGLYSSFAKKASEHNSGLLSIGLVSIDIPQHPIALHTMVVHSSKRLSSTLQEFIKMPSKIKAYDVVDMGGPVPQRPTRASEKSSDVRPTAVPSEIQSTIKKAPTKVKPLVIHFKAQLKGFTVGASLLPSLKAQYKIGEVTSTGITGNKARFTVDVPTHSLSFSSRVLTRRHNYPYKRLDRRDCINAPSNLPSSANIALPPIHVHAEYRQTCEDQDQLCLAEGLSLREGSYFKAIADVGTFEHVLTTDLLNHLVFVQKVFMKEVNEVVQKVSGTDQPVPLWSEDISSRSEQMSKPLLYSFLFRLKSIQITATTPTNNAVRLETGVIELELSNRVHRSDTGKLKEDPSRGFLPKGVSPKLFVKAQVDLNLALGTLIKNPMFEEAEAEFPHLASFATRITLRNALQDEMIPGASKDQEALLIALKRPIIFILPSAFDKAVLVWLNYKNAYEYWNEQRLALNKEVQMATQQVLIKLPLSTSEQAIGTLFLQLTVDDLGICLPMNPYSQGLTAMPKLADEQGLGGALVLTLESTQISACSYGSLVSKGKFTGFCLRFADDFEVSWDDWKPDKSLEFIMNALVVPNGTYEVCSRTINARPNEPNSNAKWILNILWQMRGIDIHLDTNIGKRLSVIGNTLTMLAGDPHDVFEEGLDEVDMQQMPSVKVEPPTRKQSLLVEDLPDFVYDSSLDSKTRARLIENEMNEQAKVVQDLKQLRASKNTIDEEERKLLELQAALFHDFRQDIMKRLKRQSVKASAIKDKLGLGNKPSHARSHSTGFGTIQGGLRRKPDGKGYSRCSSSYGEAIADGRVIPGHSRTLSIDAADLNTSTSRGSVTDGLPCVHSDFSPFLYNADSMIFPEEDSIPSSPTIKATVDNLSDSGSEGDRDARPIILRRTPASTNISTATPPLRPTPEESTTTKGISTSANLLNQQTSTKLVEPSIDFELDVKVEIDSGKCVLHPKEPKVEVAESEARRFVKGNPVSPKLVERKKSSAKKMLSDPVTLSSSRSMPAHVNSNTTVFFIPGVEVKVHYVNSSESEGNRYHLSFDEASQVHYNSKTTSGMHESPVESGSGPGSDNVDSTSHWHVKKTNVKRANLYAWLSLQQLPEEMLISPSLLDFLEQAIEPIPIEPIKASLRSNTNVNNRTNQNLDNSASSLVSSTNYAYASFPVDVVVYIRVQPSFVRFTCLPVSRVECLLRMPSLDVVFSTKKADIEASGDASPTTKPKNPTGRTSGSTSMPRPASASRNLLPSQSMLDASLSGGLSVTGCMNDFSLYVFHPYGGGQKKTSLTALEHSFRKGHGKVDEGLSPDEKGTPILESGRKDSLSLNVEFVKVNISRSRKGVLHSDVSGGGAGAATGSKFDIQSRQSTSSTAANIVRFSAVCDIGSASFKYDMRRLLEILALPKAWYRRTLARRMFLGEETTVLDSDSDSDLEVIRHLSSSPPSSSESSLLNTAYGKRSSWNDKTKDDAIENQAKNLLAGDKAVKPGIKHSTLPVTIDVQSPFPATVVPGPIAGAKATTNWETLVLFAVNLSQLDVMVNMSNAMGNTVWSTKDLKSQGRLSIDSSGYKNMKISAGLGGSKLEAKGGIIGGSIELQELNSEVIISEDPGREPEHKVRIQLGVLETRLDYMGSSILIGRISDLAVEVFDEWQVEACHHEEKTYQQLTNSRSVVVFVHGRLSWDKFHLMISRSTTPDLIKMAHKLDEFFSQQLTSSKRVLSVFSSGANPLKTKIKIKDDDSWISEIRHHRHWQKVLEHMSGCKMSMFSCTLPDHNTIVGGTMSLVGKNLSLACFHGINFRSKSWALFTMDEPYISFATDAADVVNENSANCTHIVQDLTFQLRHNMTAMTGKKQMATICKLSRGHYMPPPFTSVSEWFHYAFATSEIKDLDSFPVMIRQGLETSTEVIRRQTSRRMAEYSHDTEIIFILPSLQMHLKTEHMQGEKEPLDTETKQVVECSFVTEFEDHIFVAMDAEAVLFIHDLVTNYIKEKDKGAEKVQKSPEMDKQKIENPISVLKLDLREFNCKTWHLEPTVRLLSWAGKQIDPVGVDYILQKLGFQHARLTIPKWMQRGCMDPLDKILSVLVDKLILALREPANAPSE